MSMLLQVGVERSTPIFIKQDKQCNSRGLMQYLLVSRRGRQKPAFQVKQPRRATGTKRRGRNLLKAEEVDQLMLQVEGSNTSDLFLKVCQGQILSSGGGFLILNN